MRKILSRVTRTFRDLFAQLNRDATLVFGKEKSGTTAIAALLARRTGQSVTLDIPPIWGKAETAIRSGELDFASFCQSNRSHFSTDIIKEPCLTFLLDYAIETFSAGRHVMIVRDPRDNIRSILNRVKLPGNLAELPDKAMEQLPRGWETVLDPVWNRCDSDLHYIDVQARRWNDAVEPFLKHRNKFQLIRYEDFVADKTGAIDALADALGFEKTTSIDDELDKQFQPRGDKQITWQEFFGDRNLSRIENCCRGNILQLGYPESALS